MVDLKDVLHEQLHRQRAALLAKLDGLSERDARTPCTPTGTNLLGLVKHCAVVELGYFGPVFGRLSTLAFPWDAPGASPQDNLDMFAPRDESMTDVLRYARDCFGHADATIRALPLDAPGAVPWWPEDRRAATLGQILVHVALDEARHAGHADILREQLDGTTGLHGLGNNLPEWDAARWQAYVARLQRIADACLDVPRVVQGGVTP